MVEIRVKKFGQGPPLPPFRAMPERNRFFYMRSSLTALRLLALASLFLYISFYVFVLKN